MTRVQKKRGRPRDASLQQRRREEILDAAAPIFARHGYAGTDVQLVADALGLSKGTIYRYFPTKERLFLGSVDRGMRRLNERIQAATEGVADPLGVMEAAIAAYLAFFREFPEFVELLVQERAVFKDRKKPTYFEYRDANLAPWRALCAGLIAAGRLRDVPVERILDVTSDLVYGTMFTSYFSGRHKPLDEQVSDVVDIFFHGILSDAERRRRRDRRRTS
jgi:AcrR family transcriptional regulator